MSLSLLSLLFLIPLVASAGSLLVRKRISTLGVLAVLASALEFVGSLMVAAKVAQTGTFHEGAFSADAFGALLLVLITSVGLAATVYSISYLKKEVEKKIIGFRRVKQYFVQLHLFVFAMCFAVLTTSPILMWIAIETTTLTTAFLISFYNKPTAIEAAWKYLIINSVGLLLAFFGTLLFLSPHVLSEVHGLVSWETLLAHATAFDPFIAKIAFLFALIGYGTKVGLVPMHTWRPDAYSKAPSPIVALFSAALLNVAFLALLRYKAVTDIAVGAEYSQRLLLILGLLSVGVAAFSIFGQKNYKRLLAYSSIEHAGIMALGFGFGGVGAFAAVLHMIYHSFVKAALFFSAGNVFLKYGSTKIHNVRGALSVIPITSVLFLIGFLGITGVPPFGIFVTEFSVLAAGINTHPFVVAGAALAIALVFVGFLRHMSAMFFGEKPKDIEKGENGFWTLAPIVLLLGAFAVASFYLPSGVQSLIRSATLIY